ncbi:ornithine carbamoyltransferase [Phaeovibrio sulfidiphilus]|uniref:Ornithine carbamoyltransferase n=1 Tax=Phaeovibrio sulfidiphilus TaxID=1220600 RepID=A0A8J7CVP1_9PROT|nr:ornithine carbamoyltransferase [Phaeovibrio sulfidiphilus]MBE1236526.1 ornithine carbamoyltransferase [Phaeovibrio sulfidiphilus]
MTTSSAPRHFLDLRDFDSVTLRALISQAVGLKADHRSRLEQDIRALRGRTLAMIFEKNSTRTRVSFEVGMRQLGGDPLVLSRGDLQLSRGETISDTARVLSRYVDAIMLRTDSHDRLLELARHSSVPVINGLTEKAHPCQVMADIMTFEEHRGAIRGRSVAWVGDGNNMAYSWITAAARFDFRLRLACPTGYAPDPEILDWARANRADVEVVERPEDAVQGVDCVVTDTWVSMSHENEERDRRKAALSPYQVTASLMKQAAPDAIFMHCLPAHRGEEVTAGVLDGPQSVVWDEAENRLHAQKAILLWCLGG